MANDMSKGNIEDIKANEAKFFKDLKELFDLTNTTSKTNAVLPYGKPMNLTPVVSSVEYLGITNPKANTHPPKILDVVVRKYGGLRNELKNVASNIKELSNLELSKIEYVKKRDDIKLLSDLTDYEKSNKEKELKKSLKEVKDKITKVSGEIDKQMNRVTLRISDLANVKKIFEKKHLEISGLLTSVKKGEPIPEPMATKLQGQGQLSAVKYKKDLATGMSLCDEIMTIAKEKKDSLSRSMWIEKPKEKIEMPELLRSRRGLSKEI